MSDDYQLAQLANGQKTLFSASYGEKMHPGLGPQAEAELLHVRQLRIRERLDNTAGEFVIWDVGLGAAYRLLYSTNLKNWINIHTDTPPVDPFTFTDPLEPTNVTRFFRLATP